MQKKNHICELCLTGKSDTKQHLKEAKDNHKNQIANEDDGHSLHHLSVRKYRNPSKTKKFQVMEKNSNNDGDDDGNDIEIVESLRECPLPPGNYVFISHAWLENWRKWRNKTLKKKR